MLIPLAFFLIFLLACLALTGIIFWHIKKYLIVSHDPYSWVTLSFFAAIACFLLISVFLFFMVPWNELLEALNENFYVST